MKYKLIKKYPGSPEINTIREGSKCNEKYYPSEECMRNNPEFWQPIKKPLFITEDGGVVYDLEQIIYLVNPISLAMVEIKFGHWDKTRLIFSTKEAAEKYIYENKPVFSRKELADFVVENVLFDKLDAHFCTSWIDANKLADFINSKKE